MNYTEKLYEVSKMWGMPFTYYENRGYIDCHIFSDIQDNHFGITILRDGNKMVNCGSNYGIPVKDFEIALDKFLDEESSLREKDNAK